jgi:hypothetical protein
MAKYYVKCGTLEVILSSGKTAMEVAKRCLWEATANDELGDYFVVDERGFRTLSDPNNDSNTVVINADMLMQQEGWDLD